MAMQDGFFYAVRRFMFMAGQTVDTFNAQQATLYTGLQLEEMAEKLEAVATGTITPAARQCLYNVINPIKTLANEFKQGLHVGDVMRADRVALLDADIDLGWVSVAAANSVAKDTIGAAKEVAGTNHAKFPGGVAIRDTGGKILKPPGWKPPDLTPYVEMPENLGRADD